MTDNKLILSEIPEDTKTLATKHFQNLQKQFGHLSVLENESDVIIANKGLIEVTRMTKRWDEIQKELYGSIEDGLKTMIKALKEKKAAIEFHKQPFVEMGEMLRASINAWNRAESIKKMQLERERQAEQNRLMEEAKKGDKEAQKKIVESEPVKTEPEKKQIRSEKGMTTSVKHWTYDVADKTKIPLDLMMPDDKAIRNLIATGSREIEGLVIFETENVKVTA